MATPRKVKKYIVADMYTGTADIVDATTLEEALQSFWDTHGADDDELSYRTLEIGEYIGEYEGKRSQVTWAAI